MLMKKILSLGVYSSIMVGFLVYNSNYLSNSILKDVFTNKDKTFLQKISYFKPDYLFGRGAKTVLIKHQHESDRDESKTVYSRFINDNITKNGESKNNDK